VIIESNHDPVRSSPPRAGSRRFPVRQEPGDFVDIPSGGDQGFFPVTGLPDLGKRDVGQKTIAKALAPFGLFRHMCVGDRLTHEIACTFLAALAKSYDFEVTEDGPPEHTRFHWAPNPEFRLRLTAKNESATRKTIVGGNSPRG